MIETIRQGVKEDGDVVSISSCGAGSALPTALCITDRRRSRQRCRNHSLGRLTTDRGASVVRLSHGGGSAGLQQELRAMHFTTDASAGAHLHGIA